MKLQAYIRPTGRILSGRLWFTEILSHFLYNYTIPGCYGYLSYSFFVQITVTAKTRREGKAKTPGCKFPRREFILPFILLSFGIRRDQHYKPPPLRPLKTTILTGSVTIPIVVKTANYCLFAPLDQHLILPWSMSGDHYGGQTGLQP